MSKLNKYWQSVSKLNKFRLSVFAGIALFALIRLIAIEYFGVGIIRGVLIFSSIGLIFFVIYKGTDKFGSKDFWEKYFKGHAALPITWALLHLMVFLLSPYVAKEIYFLHWGKLLAVEICVFVLNSLTNKDTPFEKRPSRLQLGTVYGLLLISILASIYLSVFEGKLMAKFDRKLLSKVKNSTMETLLVRIETHSKEHLYEEDRKKMESFLKESKKRELPEKELKEAKEVLGAVKTRYASPKKELDKPDGKEVPRPPPRHLSGIIKVPPGQTVKLDTNGKEIKFLSCERIYAKVLIGRYRDVVWNNQNLPSFSFKKRRIIAYGRGPRNIISTVELTNTGKNDVFVEINVVPLRCA